VSGGADPSVCRIPRDGLLDVASPQLRQGPAFVPVGLADVLVQHVDGVPVTGDQRLQGAAGADRAQLAVVADEHHLRACLRRRRQKAEH
jgi:hypothetical protein